jgi:hypothetical protein
MVALGDLAVGGGSAGTGLRGCPEILLGKEVDLLDS